MKNENMGVEDLYLAPEETNKTNIVGLSNTSVAETSETIDIHKAEIKSKKPKKIEEITSQRGPNFKVFRMNDGTEQAVFSPSTIHVFDDETHTFEDVDNTLIEDEDGRHFTCGKNSFVAKFSHEDNTDDIFSIEQGMHKVTVCARKNKKNRNKGVKPLLHKQNRDDILTFAEIEPDTDYEYSVEGSGVKENIVIKKPSRVYRYSFIIKCENVTPKFDESEQRITFVNNENGDEVFYIPAPFMTDANDITSTNVNCELKTSENGVAFLTVSADDEWLNSPKRAFPVTIDPQIKVSGNTNMSSFSWASGALYSASRHTVGIATPNISYYIPESLPSGIRYATPLDINNWKYGAIECAGDEIWYSFIATAPSGRYTIYTQGYLDTMGYLYNSDGNLITSNDDCNGLNFGITANLTYGEVYYLKVKAWSTKTGTFQIIVSADNSATMCPSASRMYMRLMMPSLPRNPRIKKAELKIFQASSNLGNEENCLLGLYEVPDGIDTGACTPINDANLIDYAEMKRTVCESDIISYSFDITSLVDKFSKNESYYHNLVLKMIDESSSSQKNITVYGTAAGSTYSPKLEITYESSYGVNTSYRTHTHELGRFGQGSIDLQCGNLMFESEDFAWAGNRLPVTIKHLFNSAVSGCQYTNNASISLNTADFSSMNIGYGFKLNLMQSMMYISSLPIEWSEEEVKATGMRYDGYIYIGENGEETYFKMSQKQATCESNSQCYNLYEDINGGDMLYDPQKRTLKHGDDTYTFDTSGRLVEITDSSNNRMLITYTLNRITSVTDGAGREFGFGYNGDGQLTYIVAPNKTSIINYNYTNNLLTSIDYPDRKKVEITYWWDNKPSSVILKDECGVSIYRVEYAYNGNRVTSVTEYGANGSVGAQSLYSYSAAAARTVVTTIEPKDDGETSNNEVKTAYAFDEDGNIVSSYAYTEEKGNLLVEDTSAGINPYSGDGGMGYVGRSRNLLLGHDFFTLLNWERIGEGAWIESYHTTTEGKFGENVLNINCNNYCCYENGVKQTVSDLPRGDYTFSSYVKVKSAFNGAENAGVFLKVTDTCGNVLAVSERICEQDEDYLRLITSFTLEECKSVIVYIMANGFGQAYINAPQLEDNPFASPYNILVNGSVESGEEPWNIKTHNCTISSNERFSMKHSVKITGDLSTEKYALIATSNIKKSAGTRETFTVSGWAKGYALPSSNREEKTPTFRLRAVIYYRNGESEGDTVATADFCPKTEEWQYVSFQIAKENRKYVKFIRVFCDYDYNYGDAYFDDIQIVRNSIETGLTNEDFTFTDTSTEQDEDTVANVSETAPTFAEAKDKFGNALTETTFTDGEFGTIYRAFKFNADDDCMAGDDAGNNLIEETDTRGHKTTYTVDGDTSRNEEVTDRLGNKTAYEYDDSGRTTKVISKDASGNELASVSYAYDHFDNMTEIVRGDGMKYALAYNEFHNLESIGINGKTENLIKYTYRNGNGRLKEITYANGDTMKATYNSIGQMVAEKWYNSSNELTAYYKYLYDGEGNIIRSIDIPAEKEYNYEYDEGKLVRATESDVIISDDIVISKSVVNSIRYYYDSEGKITKKVITPTDGTAQTVYYENNDDNTVIKFNVPAPTPEDPNKTRVVTAHSNTDSFGRKVFDEVQFATGCVSRHFSYHDGKVTTEHTLQEKVKSTATTQLVKQIVLSDGRTLSYEYDAEERITKVTDSVNGITEYTYDALGQLVTETVNGVVINSMKYDNYGNIIEKNGKQYCYDDPVWRDLLTCYDGQCIDYDAQGNPMYYLGHNLTWEKGRQLKSFDGNTYTYNANGIRTSKTINGIKHTYTLEGTKILREEWTDECYTAHSITPLYDNEDSVCGIIYNTIPYYFVKNLQGDIIAIVDKNSETVAKYSYDAWGVCTVTQDSVGIATVNPFRYRGYYYDEEIELYYLQSRYYNANVGRFVNADSKLGINTGTSSYALYSYCGNAPIFRIDTNGCAWWGILIATVVTVITIAHVVNAGVAISQANYNKSHDTKKLVFDQEKVTMKLGCETFAEKGCGAAATHNAIILAGGSSSLANVVEFMQAHDLTLGFAGVYFTNIQLYLKRKGYSNRIYLTKLKNNLDKKIKKCKRKIAILAYNHSSGGHYIAIKYKADKKFHIYNGNNNEPVESIDQWIKNSSSRSPLCLITI